MLPVLYVSITPTHTVTEHETAMANFALSCPLVHEIFQIGIIALNTV